MWSLRAKLLSTLASPQLIAQPLPDIERQTILNRGPIKLLQVVSDIAKDIVDARHLTGLVLTQAFEKAQTLA